MQINNELVTINEFRRLSVLARELGLRLDIREHKVFCIIRNENIIYENESLGEISSYFSMQNCLLTKIRKLSEKASDIGLKLRVEDSDLFVDEPMNNQTIYSCSYSITEFKENEITQFLNGYGCCLRGRKYE